VEGGSNPRKKHVFHYVFCFCGGWDPPYTQIICRMCRRRRRINRDRCASCLSTSYNFGFVPSHSRGGLGWGWVFVQLFNEMMGCTHPTHYVTHCPSGGCHSSTLLPSGSMTQPNFPYSESSVFSRTSQPSLRNAARRLCRSATR
jgi:hypothetical protein